MSYGEEKNNPNGSSRPNVWIKVRFVILGFAFVSGLIAPIQQLQEFLESVPNWMLIMAAVIVLAFIATLPALMLTVIQAVNPLSNEVWMPPSHRSNPIQFGNPLVFFHFASFLLAACGLGEVVSSIWLGTFAAIHGVLLIIAAGMILLGVRLCLRVFRHKVAPTE